MGEPGWRAQERLWKFADSSELQVVSPRIVLVQKLMCRCKNVPMDFADATLASKDSSVRIATLDSDFLAYRRDDGSPVPLIDDRLLGWS